MLISPNNVYQGDCYKLIKEIPDDSIDLIYTDIPYLYEDGGHGHSELGDRMKRQRSEIKDISNGIEYSIFEEFERVLKYIYIWCSTKQISSIMRYFEEKGCRINILVWCKTNPAPKINNVWLTDTEYCLCIKGKGAPKYNTEYELKHKWYVSSANVDDKRMYNHPTIKPIELVKRHIRHSTNTGDVVLDPFMGSGTTCKACQELDRQYIGFEIDSNYYEIAKDRLSNINAKGEVSLF